MDLASVFGTIIALSAIVVGQVLEGGSLSQLFQATAAVIVIGGTLGAVLISHSTQEVVQAFKMLSLVFEESATDLGSTIEEIHQVALMARKDGLLAIEGIRLQVKDPLFKKCIKYVVDGFEPHTVNDIVETDIQSLFDEEESAARVFESAGGYAPTIGILGAVLGLIHVMSKLDDPSKIGEGIAVAFVATLYGVGLANLMLLPWSSKIKSRAHARMQAREVIKLGVIGIQEGQNPGFLKAKLEVMARGASHT